MTNKLILTWRNPESRLWVPVAQLSHSNGKYIFNYTNGAKTDNFMTFGNMVKLDNTYQSDELFPLFKNRLLSKSRPEYDDYMGWLDIDSNDITPMNELSKSSGIRATDSLQIFPIPEKNAENKYEVYFFAHGLSHMAKTCIDRIKLLEKNDKLFLMQDIQNEYDPLALVLRTDEPPEMVGYCPAFFVKDFNKLIQLNDKENVKVTIEKVNPEAPIQYRLLCKLTTSWPEGFLPFDDEEYSLVEKS